MARRVRVCRHAGVHDGGADKVGRRGSTRANGTETCGDVMERAPRRRDWGVRAGEVVTLRARVWTRVHVSAHGQAGVQARACTHVVQLRREKTPRWRSANRVPGGKEKERL
jgi:hypothetical protein